MQARYEGLRTRMVYPVPRNVCVFSLSAVFDVNLELKYCMLQHLSSQVSYLHDTCNRIPVHATNCPPVGGVGNKLFRI